MEKVIQLNVVNPELNSNGTPVWFDESGLFMVVDKEEFLKEKNPLIIKCPSENPNFWIRIHKNGDEFLVQWEIYYTRDYLVLADERLSTWRRFDRSEYERAFCLTDGFDFQRGKFVRWKGFLALLARGTGLDGYPNMFVYLDMTIVSYTKQLLSL